jgi:hypothetical protein
MPLRTVRRFFPERVAVDSASPTTSSPVVDATRTTLTPRYSLALKSPPLPTGCPPHAPCALVPSLWVAVLVSLSTPRLHKIDSPHHSSALSTVKDPPRRREQLKSADAAGSAMGVGQLPCFSKLGHQPELAVPLRWARLEASPQCTLGFSIFFLYI